MKSSEKRIRIILDVPKKTASYNNLVGQWENEGGAIIVKQNSKIIPEAKVPFREGDTFQVIKGVIDFIDEEVYYIVDVKKIDNE